MSFSDIATKFTPIGAEEVCPGLKYEYSKAEGDEVYQVITRTAVDKPFFKIYGIQSIEFMSKKRFERFKVAVKEA